MVYGYATTNVPSFVNYARTFGEMGGLPAEVIIKTQQRMFARRDVKQRPCDMQLIHDMHRLTQDCLLYTSPSPRDLSTSRMPSSA